MGAKKEIFARNLRKCMDAKRWTQSELARQAGLPRDSISVYMRGKSLPTAQSLAKLAAALGVPEEELLPPTTVLTEQLPDFEFRHLPDMPNMAWLRVERMVSVPVALKIIDILHNDKISERDD